MRKTLHIAFILILFTSCQKPETLRVLHAGSLSVPFKVIAGEFEKQYPGVEVQLEGAGSLTSVRKITDLNQMADVLAVADYALIDHLMIPEYTDYTIQFAGNEMAIGFQKGSIWEELLTTENWYNYVLADTVQYGRSDPDHDPSGYRTLLLAGLAEQLYDLPGFQDQISAKDTRFVRPKGTELLPLMATGAIDLVFHYKSVLIQHQLGYLKLPDSLNLRNPDLDEWYGSACTTVKGNEEGTTLRKCGEAMVYGVCLPNTAENSERAESFIRFLVNQGQVILDSLGQPPLTPSITEKSRHTPEWLKN